jgi:hypothetical protein
MGDKDIEVTTMNIDDIYVTEPYASIGAGSYYGAAVNLLPGATPASVEEFLNGRNEVIEGVKAKMERIQTSHYVVSNDFLDLLGVVLVATSAEPSNSAGVDCGANASLRDLLNTLCSVEYSFQLMNLAPVQVELAYRADNEPLMVYRVSGDIAIPEKWRQIGICQSDEHLAGGAGLRTYLLGLMLKAGDLADNTGINWYGTTHLRYNTESYNSGLTGILEGIE